MYSQIKAAVIRSQDTLLGDVLGVMALMTALVVGLYLPGFL
ncbi:MAG: hypothetical protein P1U83_04805 [Roseovarius sp.]|nr:hypothetical protein [Roseovarius sp.]